MLLIAQAVFTECSPYATFRSYTLNLVGRDRAVGIATRYGLDRSGDRILVGARFCAPGPGAHSASYTMGTGSFPGVKRPGRGVDHPPPLAPRLKKEY